MVTMTPNRIGLFVRPAPHSPFAAKFVRSQSGIRLRFESDQLRRLDANVGAKTPANVGVPVILPKASRLRPGGKPVADHPAIWFGTPELVPSPYGSVDSVNE